jgi:hypothetical protein
MHFLSRKNLRSEAFETVIGITVKDRATRTVYEKSLRDRPLGNPVVTYGYLKKWIGEVT